MAEVRFTISDKFLRDAWGKVLRFARSYCKGWASDSECEDMVQEAMMTMYKNVQDGKLTDLTCELSTYVIGILKKIALKAQQEKSKISTVMGTTGQAQDDVLDPVDMATAQHAITLWQDADQEEVNERLRNEMRSFVENMPDPCKTILQLYYWEGKSMKTIAEEMQYNNGDVAKAQKSRCMTKVKEGMSEIRKKMRL